MSKGHRAKSLEQRTNSYKLLAECYYPPDEKLIERLNSIEELPDRLYLEIVKHIPGVSPVRNTLSHGVSELGLLEIDYATLFVGPYKLLAPPYGSVYLEDGRKGMGDSTVSVRH